MTIPGAYAAYFQLWGWYGLKCETSESYIPLVTNLHDIFLENIPMFKASSYAQRCRCDLFLNKQLDRNPAVIVITCMVKKTSATLLCPLNSSWNHDIVYQSPRRALLALCGKVFTDRAQETPFSPNLSVLDKRIRELFGDATEPMDCLGKCGNQNFISCFLPSICGKALDTQPLIRTFFETCARYAQRWSENMCTGFPTLRR